MITQKEFIKQLKKLVAIPSLTNNFEENAKALDYIQTLVSPKATIQRIQNNSAEILLISNAINATKNQLFKPDFGYLVHVDVVAAEDDLWEMTKKEETLQNKESNKKHTILRGRGVSDMKYSIPIGISIINDLITEKSEKVVTVAITTDEEVGGPNGAQHLIKTLDFKPKLAAIVPDGGDDFKFVEKAKGILQLKLVAKGSAAHGSRPWKGKSSNNAVIKVLSTILKKYEKNSLEENWGITCNIGILNGGISVNQVSPKTEVALDIRYPETVNPEKIIEELNKIINAVETQTRVEMNLKITGEGSPTFTDVNLPIVKDFIKTIEEHVGEKLNIIANFGASDGRFFTEFDIPVLMTKPTGGDIHESSEWISANASIAYMKGIKAFIDNYKKEN